MGSKDDLQTALRSLRNVRRMARRLQRVPVDCLRVNSGDIADAEYEMCIRDRPYASGAILRLPPARVAGGAEILLRNKANRACNHPLVW